MFGSKKIFAKIMNKKLVARVGGGYQDMGDFIETYAESERLKLLKMDPKEVELLHATVTPEKRNIEPPKKGSQSKSPRGAQASGRKSFGSK